VNKEAESQPLFLWKNMLVILSNLFYYKDRFNSLKKSYEMDWNG